MTDITENGGEDVEMNEMTENPQPTQATPRQLESNTRMIVHNIHAKRCLPVCELVGNRATLGSGILIFGTLRYLLVEHYNIRNAASPITVAAMITGTIIGVCGIWVSTFRRDDENDLVD